MKKIFYTLIAFISLTSASVVPSKEAEKTSTVLSSETKIDFSKITVEQLIKLKPSTIKEISGQELSLKQKIVLFKIQRDLKREVRRNNIDKNKSVDFNQYLSEGEGGFRFGGFALGLFFGLLGVLLSYLVSQDSSYRKSAWIGFGSLVAIILGLTLLLI